MAIVDYIVAWEVEVDTNKSVKDTFTCFGNISKVPKKEFKWEIKDIESDEGASYKKTVQVIGMKSLVEKTFGVKFLKKN